MTTQAISNRIQQLQTCCEEEDLGSINEESLSLFHDFIDFLQDYGSLISLDISLTPDNEVYADWSSGRKRYFFRFMADKAIRFGVMK